MNGNYHTSRFLANEQINDRLQVAQAHRQAKLAGQGNGLNFRAKSRKVAGVVGHLFSQLFNALPVLRVARPAVR